MKLFWFLFYVIFGASTIFCEKKAYEKTHLQGWDFYKAVFQKKIAPLVQSSFVKKKEPKEASKGRDMSLNDSFVGVGLSKNSVDSDKNKDGDLKKKAHKSVDKQKIKTPRLISPPKKKPHIVIKGVVVVSGRKRVCFQNKSNNKTYFLAEKDSHDGVMVEEIDDAYVRFIVNKEKLLVKRSM